MPHHQVHSSFVLKWAIKQMWHEHVQIKKTLYRKTIVKFKYVKVDKSLSDESMNEIKQSRLSGRIQEWCHFSFWVIWNEILIQINITKVAKKSFHIMTTHRSLKYCFCAEPERNKHANDEKYFLLCVPNGTRVSGENLQHFSSPKHRVYLLRWVVMRHVR